MVTFYTVKLWLLLKGMDLLLCSSAVSVPYSKWACVHRDHSVSWGKELEAFFGMKVQAASIEPLTEPGMFYCQAWQCCFVRKGRVKITSLEEGGGIYRKFYIHFIRLTLVAWVWDVSQLLCVLPDVLPSVLRDGRDGLDVF